MKRLIDADALKVGIDFVLSHVKSGYSNWLQGYIAGLSAVLKALEASPTIDAVEVIRCEDCNFWRRCGETNKGECDGMDVYGLMDAYDFCSFGERKEEK